MPSHDDSQPYPVFEPRLAEKARSEAPAGLAEKIPHPDTDPRQREKKAQKFKLMNEVVTNLDDDDFAHAGSDEDFEFYNDDADFEDFDDDVNDDMSAEETNDGEREDQDE